MQKITIGRSDYTREQMVSGESAGGWGTSTHEFLKSIEEWEQAGYIVKFEKRFLRGLFFSGIYKVVAYK